MKIAFCLSGQPRTWKQCYSSWFLLIEEMKKSPKFGEDIEVDFFIHMWDFNTKPFSTQLKNGHFEEDLELVNNIFKIDKNEIDEMLNILKPKKYLIENYEKSVSRKEILDDEVAYRTKRPDMYCVISWAASQLYGLMMCGHLKREYEIENNFEYDVCFRFRFDVNFDDFNRSIIISDYLPVEDNTIYACHSHTLYGFPHDVVGDLFFYSNSFTFDIVTSFYKWLPIIDVNIFPLDVKIESVFSYFIRIFNIKNLISKIDPEIKRINYENSHLF